MIRLCLDLGELEEWPSTRLGEEFQTALTTALPGLAEHGCSYGEPGGFLRRLGEDEGTWMGHILEHAAIELQNMAGAKVTFGKTRSNGTPGQYDVVYQYESRDVGLEAGRLALALLESLLPEDLRTPFDNDYTLQVPSTALIEAAMSLESEAVNHRLHLILVLQDSAN